MFTAVFYTYKINNYFKYLHMGHYEKRDAKKNYLEAPGKSFYCMIRILRRIFPQH